MKRGSVSQERAGDAKKRRVSYTTFQKWQRELDREHQTMLWLDCSSEYEGRKVVVSQLKCKVCSEFVDRIRGSKNFSDKWIVGADSVRVSNVRDHVQSDQHAHAMMLLKKQRAKSAGLPPLNLCSNCSGVYCIVERGEGENCNSNLTLHILW